MAKSHAHGNIFCQFCHGNENKNGITILKTTVIGAWSHNLMINICYRRLTVDSYVNIDSRQNDVFHKLGVI